MRSLDLGPITVTPLLDSAIRVPGDELLRAGSAHFPVLDGVRGLRARTGRRTRSTSNPTGCSG